MLIIYSTYRINKYKLPLLEIIGVISIEKTSSVGFTFLDSEKEKNVTWDLDVCRAMLKDKENTPKVIVTDRDTTLINLIAKVFPNSYILLCRYHITKNVRSPVKLAVGTKQIKGEDRIIVEASVNGKNNGCMECQNNFSTK